MNRFNQRVAITDAAAAGGAVRTVYWRTRRPSPIITADSRVSRLHRVRKYTSTYASVCRHNYGI